MEVATASFDTIAPLQTTVDGAFASGSFIIRIVLSFSSMTVPVTTLPSSMTSAQERHFSSTSFNGSMIAHRAADVERFSSSRLGIHDDTETDATVSEESPATGPAGARNVGFRHDELVRGAALRRGSLGAGVPGVIPRPAILEWRADRNPSLLLGGVDAHGSPGRKPLART